MNRAHRGAALAVCILLLTACAADPDGQKRSWFSRRSTPSNQPLAGEEARSLGYTTAWAKQLPVHRQERVSHAALLDDLIVTVKTPKNIVSVISVRDGAIRWFEPVGTLYEKLHEPRRTDPRILVNSNSRLYQLDAKDGQLLYTTQLDHAVNHAPAIVGDLAIFGGGNGVVFAHDLTSGFAKWRYKMPTGINSSPVTNGFHVFITDSSGVYKMLEAATGALLWDGRSFEPITAQSAIGPAVYVASHDQTLYALDRHNGADRWKYRDSKPITTDPVLIGRYLFLPLARGGLIAFNATDGKELWRLDGSGQVVAIDAAKAIVNMGRSLRWVDLSSGRTLREADTKPLQKVFALSDGGLILLATDGAMQRIDPLR